MEGLECFRWTRGQGRDVIAKSRWIQGLLNTCLFVFFAQDKYVNQMPITCKIENRGSSFLVYYACDYILVI